jgi:5-methylcytosine-specific restriction endonuclease McrA
MSVGAHGKLFGRDVRLIRGSCAYCGGEASGWDHIVPLSRGGENTVANLVPCCTDCNRRKAARTPAAWRASDPERVAAALR